MTIRKKVLASAGVITAAVLALRCTPSEMPELADLPQQLKPFAREIARSKLPHIDARAVIGPTMPWDSKLRGVPYYPKDKPWPLDAESRPLVMLVQLNFAEMPPLAGYPTEGIVQIYISAEFEPEKQMWGMRNDNKHNTQQGGLTDQSYFRVIYFPRVSRNVEDLVTATPAIEFDDDSRFPALDEARLTFASGSGYVRPDDYRFRRVFGMDRSEFFRRIEGDKSDIEEAYGKFTREPYYFARIGGYSRVEQIDPRLEFPDEDWILLFSLDSEGPGGYAVDWGDGGVGNFYIRPEDLARRDFSKVMYYWDEG